MITNTLQYICIKTRSDSAHQLDQPLPTTYHPPPSSITSLSKYHPIDHNTRKHQPSTDHLNKHQQPPHPKMCTFTPYLFPNCRCTQITTGPLDLCGSATRTGEKCPKPKRQLLQKRPGTCGPCKQAQVAREKAKAESEARAGREDSFIDGSAILGKGKSADVARSASKSSVGGKGRRKSGNAKAASESTRVPRSGANTTLPTR